jgi:hypothetical protein
MAAISKEIDIVTLDCLGQKNADFPTLSSKRCGAVFASLPSISKEAEVLQIMPTRRLLIDKIQRQSAHLPTANY